MGNEPKIGVCPVVINITNKQQEEGLGKGTPDASVRDVLTERGASVGSPGGSQGLSCRASRISQEASVTSKARERRGVWEEVGTAHGALARSLAQCCHSRPTTPRGEVVMVPF